METSNVREALSKALSDVGASQAPVTTQRRTTIVAAPEPVSDPRYAEYGAALLAAARADAVGITFDSFWAWRRRHPEIEGVGAITLIRLWRAHTALESI
jgi:hypothetical protein